MQTIEAMLSLLFFASIASLALSAAPAHQVDDSLYRLHLAEDAWRVLYLRGDLRDLGGSRRAHVESEMALIQEQAGFCLFMSGIEFTNCRDGASHERVAALARTVIYDGYPRRVTFSVQR
ncbi:MAG: hypothetical protein AB1529_00290 [Candidatus Micrarchaeota archaeon]